LQRRTLVLLVLAGLPLVAAAQPVSPGGPRATVGSRQDGILGLDHDALSPEARERVRQAFRNRLPDISTESIRQRWNAMTVDQRREVLNIGDTRAPPSRQPAVEPSSQPGVRRQSPADPSRSPAAAPGRPGFLADQPERFSSLVIVVMVCLFGLGASIYFLPTVAAVIRRDKRTGAIFVLNLFVGWTLVGWVLLLMWSVLSDNVRARPEAG